MSKYMFILSFLIHLGFFFLLLNMSSASSPDHEIIDISIGSPGEKEESKQNDKIEVIPKGDTDALGKECPYTYGGIGIQSGAFNEVINVFKGYAADRAGIILGDILFSEGEIRGEPGSVLNLRVKRNNNYINFTIIREKICYDI